MKEVNKNTFLQQVSDLAASSSSSSSSTTSYGKSVLLLSSSSTLNLSLFEKSTTTYTLQGEVPRMMKKTGKGKDLRAR